MIFFEPQCSGFEHVEVNAAMLLTYVNGFPKEKIFFLGEKEHIKLVSENLSDYSLNIEYQSIDLPNIHSSYLSRFCTEFKNVKNVLSFFQKEQKILLLSITSPTLLSIKLLNIFFSKNIYIVIHGILETIVEKPKNILKRFFWFKYYLINFNTTKIKYILLGESIKNNLLINYPYLENYLASIDLPYFYNRVDNVRNNISDKVRFVCPGVASTKKGSHLFFNLARDVSQYNTSYDFTYVGKFVDDNMLKYVNDYVNIPSKNEALNRERFEKYLNDSDFIVLFYPKDLYRLTASGILFDAIKFEKPIIALKNDFFEYYFNKYGEIGWLCNDYNEVLNLLKSGIEKRDFSKQFKYLQEELSIEKQSNIFKDIIN